MNRNNFHCYYKTITDTPDWTRNPLNERVSVKRSLSRILQQLELINLILIRRELWGYFMSSLSQ